MTKRDETYLGKNGKIFGPYTSSELDQLTKSGKLESFSWIWDMKSEVWKPLESPPPSPFAENSLNSSSRSWEKLKVLCRDRFNVLSGQLSHVTQTGCKFISLHGGGEPKLSISGNQVLDLYDPDLKDCAKVIVQVMGVERSNLSWVYRLKWDEIPSFGK